MIGKWSFVVKNSSIDFNPSSEYFSCLLDEGGVHRNSAFIVITFYLFGVVKVIVIVNYFVICGVMRTMNQKFIFYNSYLKKNYELRKNQFVGEESSVSLGQSIDVWSCDGLL